MVTQEIGLNEALAAEGISAWETDLAELIVQLADDLPSHILVPAIHRNRAEVREIFRTRMAAAGRPAPDDLTDDPAELANAARLHLREKFLRAKVGVSGANFAVAETGTLVVVESEGNGRMCLTLPEVLVSVVGIEKVVPTFADLDVFLRLLPRSSTGERMNPYTSMWHGVTPGDGPQEVHVVLLDNGRTRALADEVGRQALRCIRCSACLNVCPVYERVGGHAYGSVYPGPIGAILNPLLHGVGDDAQIDSLPYASTLCGACYEVCPVKIDIPSVLVDLRAQVVDAHRRRAGLPKTEAVAMRVRPGRSATRGGSARAERASGLVGRVWGRLGRTSLPAGAARSAACRVPGPRGRAPATSRRRRGSRSAPGGGGPTDERPRRDPRSGAIGTGRRARRAHGGRAAAYRRPVASTSSRCSASGSRTTEQRWNAAPPPTSPPAYAPRCPRERASSCRPTSTSRCPGPCPTTGSPPPTSTPSMPSSPAPGSGSPRPARSCSTTAPARAVARSRSSPTAMSASSTRARSSPTSPTRSTSSTRPAR